MKNRLWLLVFACLLASCSLPVSLPFTVAEQKTADVAQICPTCQPANCPICPTSLPCPATATPLPPSPTATFTVIPTNTNTPTQIPTNTVAVPSATSTQLPTSAPARFTVQQGSPVYLQNFAHSSEGCNWTGVAGQVFNRQGSPMKNLVVVVEGFIENQPVELIALTGLAPAYGTGGFEITLRNKTFNGTNSLFITVYDLNGVPLTAPYPVNPIADCAKNLMLINFSERP